MSTLQYQNPSTVDAVLDSVSLGGSPELRREILVLGDSTGANVTLVTGRVPVDGSGVTQPVSISGSVPVTGTFFQATQPVSIAASVPVTGTFFQATQPVSIAAAVDVSDRTARLLGNVRNQDGSGNALTSTGSALDVNLKTSSITLPVSIAGSVAVTGTFFQATQPVSIAATVSENLAQLNAVALGSPSAYGTPPGAVNVLGVNAFITNTPAVTLASTTITGTVAVTQSTSPWVVSLASTTITGTVAENLTQVGGAAVTLGIKTSANSIPVVLASDEATLPVSIAGTVNVSVQNATLAVTQSTSPWVVAGNLTNNNAAPAATNIGSLVAIANANPPSFTEGRLVFESLDLSGYKRVTQKRIATVELFAAVFTATSVANASGGNTVYTGTWSVTVTTQSFINKSFVTSTFAQSVNNGTFNCVAMTATTLTLNNPSGVVDTTGLATFGSPLGVSATFVGNWHDTVADGTGYVNYTAYVDQNSLAAGMYIQTSDDTVSSVLVRQLPLPAKQVSAQTFVKTSTYINERYWRVVFKNGTTAQQFVALNTTSSAMPEFQTDSYGNTMIAIMGADGVSMETVKAASTAAVTADTSLVVQLSPIQPNLTTPLNVNTSQFGGSVVVTGIGVSGVGIPRVTVSSDSFPATQPISAVSLPLPSGASTDANLISGNDTRSQIMLILESTRRAIVALACEGGRNSPVDFDPNTIAREEGTDDYAD